MKQEFRSSADEMHNALEFYAKQQKPVCYGWFRDGRALYIGSSMRGFTRILTHSVINIVDYVRPEDEFFFWFTTKQSLLEYEKYLIVFHHPLYNVVHNGKLKILSPKLKERLEQNKRFCKTCYRVFYEPHPKRILCRRCNKAKIKSRKEKARLKELKRIAKIGMAQAKRDSMPSGGSACK